MSSHTKLGRKTAKKYKQVLVALLGAIVIAIFMVVTVGNMISNYMAKNHETAQVSALEQLGFTNVTIQNLPYQDGPTTAHVNATPTCELVLTWSRIGNARADWALVGSNPEGPIYRATSASALAKQPGVCN